DIEDRLEELERGDMHVVRGVGVRDAVAEQRRRRLDATARSRCCPCDPEPSQPVRQRSEHAALRAMRVPDHAWGNRGVGPVADHGARDRGAATKPRPTTAPGIRYGPPSAGGVPPPLDLPPKPPNSLPRLRRKLTHPPPPPPPFPPPLLPPPELPGPPAALL